MKKYTERLLRKIECLILGHKWHSLLKNFGGEYRISCARCGAGDKKWKKNYKIIIRTPKE